jgi:deoxyribose-phosphate aldolase
VGKVLGGQWDYVEQEIKEINEAVVEQGSILKVIFETDFLKTNTSLSCVKFALVSKLHLLKLPLGMAMSR